MAYLPLATSPGSWIENISLWSGWITRWASLARLWIWSAFSGLYGLLPSSQISQPAVLAHSRVRAVASAETVIGAVASWLSACMRTCAIYLANVQAMGLYATCRKINELRPRSPIIAGSRDQLTYHVYWTGHWQDAGEMDVILSLGSLIPVQHVSVLFHTYVHVYTSVCTFTHVWFILSLLFVFMASSFAVCSNLTSEGWYWHKSGEAPDHQQHQCLWSYCRCCVLDTGSSWDG